MSTSLEQTPCTILKGVGGKLAATLAKLGIESVQDLLFHLPRGYLDRTRIKPLAQMRLGDNALVQGLVLNSRIVFGRRRSLMVTIEDESGSLNLRFFHFNATQKNSFEQGRTVRCYGEARPGPSGLEFYHPEYEFPDSEVHHAPDESLTPVYSLTDGLSQLRLRKLSQEAIKLLNTRAPEELLPASVNQQFSVDSLSAALQSLHFPPQDADIAALLEGRHPAQRRLAFEELLAHFLVHQEIRAEAQAQSASAIIPNAQLKQNFLKQLPFKPTNAQMRVLGEIEQDMQLGQPMLRMVQGDVGSGKTLVAALAAINVVAQGLQVALVAPTEILAEQHALNFHRWFDELNIEVDVLSGGMKAKEKNEVLAKLASGESQIVVGTHALFQQGVEFASLGLAIIDEQHRFGVDQRLSLRNKSQPNAVAHQLMMTATPIPRTLAMTAYAELDFSIIDELPPGRIPINTAVISQKRRDQIIDRIRLACQEGRQSYWVCPLIEESEELELANAEERFAELTEKLKPLNVGLIHGRLKPAEKDSVMRAFKANQLQALVATTVIEVGVDVPNASLMIIENPERLGLAQLHQLRGRVGRGSQESHCILLYGDKLSENGKKRLGILRDSNDGFVIAEKDLEMRGPGEFLGTRQAGNMIYRVADSERDADMFEEVHRVGQDMLVSQPIACKKLIERWFGKRTHYAMA